MDVRTRIKVKCSSPHGAAQRAMLRVSQTWGHSAMTQRLRQAAPVAAGPVIARRNCLCPCACAIGLSGTQLPQRRTRQLDTMPRLRTRLGLYQDCTG